jgi:hypothetical protein
VKYTYTRTPEIKVDGKLYEKDDIVRIDGEYGTRFIFEGYVVNDQTGKDWVDVYELQKSQVAYRRSFNKDRIRPLRKKAKPRVRAASKGDATAIRAWAKSQSIAVSERGRISKEIREAYEASRRD